MIAPVISISEESISQAARSEMSVEGVVALFNKVVAGSFREERLRGDRSVASLNEIKRRTMIVWKWFRIMRYDCGYTVDRTNDFLPIAVRKELDGVAFEPPSKNNGWSPDGLARSAANGG